LSTLTSEPVLEPVADGENGGDNDEGAIENNAEACEKPHGCSCLLGGYGREIQRIQPRGFFNVKP